MEVNNKYDFHIEELKNKIRILLGELQLQKDGRGKMVQQQIKAFNQVDSSTQTSVSPTSSMTSFSSANGGGQQSRSGESGGVAGRSLSTEEVAPPPAPPPPPPPPPPIGTDDGTLIPPPPPVPFGELFIATCVVQ